MNNQVLLLFFINIFSAMGYSLIAPLYPSLSTEHHINETLTGWIISIFALSNFISTPFTPNLCQKYGRKNIFYFSTITEASCTIFYGILKIINSYYLLITLSFILRILHGIGCGITATLLYSLTSSICDSDEVKLSLGYLEVAWSIGVATGPLLGSFFYYLGGYSLPFFILGLSLYISVFLIHYLSLPIEDNNDENNFSFIQIMFKKDIFINILTVVTYQIANTFYFPSLTNHLMKNFNLTVSISSLFFVINMFTYFIALQFLDYITKKLGMIATVSFGLLIIIFGSLLVYPIKIFPQSLLLIILGLSLIGASGAPINVPVIMLLGHFIKINDNSIDEFTANDIASALYNLGINIGDFGGPIVGGFISDQFGFQFSCIFTSFLNLVLFIIYFGIYFNVILREIGVSNDDNNKKLIFDEEDINKEFNKNSSYSSFGSLKFVSQRKHTSFISIHRIESKENSIRKSYEDDFY